MHYNYKTDNNFLPNQMLKKKKIATLYWDLRAKQLTSGGELVNFNKRYQNTKKIDRGFQN